MQSSIDWYGPARIGEDPALTLTLTLTLTPNRSKRSVP